MGADGHPTPGRLQRPHPPDALHRHATKALTRHRPPVLTARSLSPVLAAARRSNARTYGGAPGIRLRTNPIVGGGGGKSSSLSVSALMHTHTWAWSYAHDSPCTAHTFPCCADAKVAGQSAGRDEGASSSPRPRTPRSSRRSIGQRSRGSSASPSAAPRTTPRASACCPSTTCCCAKPGTTKRGARCTSRRRGQRGEGGGSRSSG